MITRIIASALLVVSCAHPIARPLPLERIINDPDSVQAAMVSTYLATVSIRTPDGGTGSGSLISEGLILTAAHVVWCHNGEVCPTARVTFSNGGEFTTIVVRADRSRDLALLGLSVGVGIRPLALASASPDLFTRVWSFGSPYDEAGHVGAGYWSCMRDTPNRSLRVITGGFTWPGMSGGPVVNSRGALVGVVKSVFRWPLTKDVSIPIAHMGLAVDWDDVRHFLQ